MRQDGADLMMADEVALHARLSPGRAALVELASGRRWTYAELDGAIGRWAALLQSRYSVNAGDRVAILSRNSAETIILSYAANRAGAVFVPLNWRLSRPELEAVLADCGPALVTSSELGSWVDGSIEIDKLAREAGAFSHRAAISTCDREAPALILYTSGTSGGPKGAVLSRRAMDETAVNYGILGRVGLESSILTDSPLFHVIGLLTNVRAFLYAGARVLLSDGFEPQRTYARLSDPELSITHYFCVPQMAKMIRSVPLFDPIPLRRLTGMFTGGAPNHAADIEQWVAEGVVMANGYGMTECGTLVGMPPDLQAISRRPLAAGVHTHRVDVRVSDDGGVQQATGAIGEVQIRGYNLMSGYWGRREPHLDQHGWFRTGDLGSIDEEGFLTIVGRQKEMFISGGENVYPAEIENAASAHPAVAECAVIGVKDARWGESGHLFVVVESSVSLDDVAILEFLRERLAPYKVPKKVSVLASLPRNAAGKVLKKELRDLASRH